VCLRLVATPANFKWPGDGTYIGLQVNRAVESHWPLFCGAPDRPVKGHRCIRSLTASALAVGLLTADVVSPDRPVLSHRFIRCSLSPLPLSQYCTGALLLWGTGVSGPEDLLLGCLTCSMSRSMVLAPTALLAPPVHPVLLAPSPVVRALHGPMHRSWGTGASDTNRLDRCGITGVSGPTDSCRTSPIRYFFKLFLCVLFCLAFLLHPWDL
jgi:hypothetical protein